ncbi:MAG: D-aminoacylase [Pseudomonadota bacterium]|nr:D-aminoacylase [Pseudomonadota bacterium]
MRIEPLRPLMLLLAGMGTCLAGSVAGAGLLITHVIVYDGGGGAPRNADVRIRGDRITAVAAHLKPLPGETVRDEHGLSLAPGFIDMHTHGDRGLLEDLDAATITRQGVTTILIGQDGESHFPLRDYFAQLEATPPAVNVASMIGHATLREQAMGKDLYRASTAQELAKMQSLLAHELGAGAFGLSTGLEYEQGHFATTGEVVELSKVAAAAGGFYISHVRDETNRVFESFDEVLTIGREARIPVEITHIKLGATGVWHLAPKRMPRYFADAAREHVNLMADVYPYTFWHSTIRVLIPDRDYYNPAKVVQALADNGGAGAIRLAHYVPEPAMAGKTLEQIATAWHISPVEAYMRIVKATSAEVDSGQPMEDIMASSMSEDDLRWFIAQPRIMFSSDGELHGPHPRGAGSFPRVLGRYVREEKVLPLATAIHKMTGLPAQQLGLADRGRIAAGCVADLVLFDPAVVIDRATIDVPEAPPLGIPSVMVAGAWVVDGGRVTAQHPGRVLRHVPAMHPRSDSEGT